MKAIAGACSLFWTAAFASGAGAAVRLEIDGAGQLTDATGVDVDGSLYHVEFVDGTCAALFVGCDDLASSLSEPPLPPRPQ